ncbi:alpha-L-rhamnosidase-related protein [Flammeovirga pacifica]|uniref:Alpha-L-rhamnosidase six-hairpin glycosidase domain-containing protein n=1 Tax=Flammeovirga pacifica TaxID=915059 RepID=A0A1S1YSQ9_FLAPC|nr:hypothetical protein [Flammeovirga pacifica]OHX63903.1 hypothetical protein NH26_20030 [Flammeovirga pacifica]
MNKVSLFVVLGLFLFGCQHSSETLYSNSQFEVKPDQIIQGDYSTSLINNTLKSNYISKKDTLYSSLLKFKISINGKDNELSNGQFHYLSIDSDTSSNIIKLGQADQPPTGKTKKYIPTNYDYTFYLDASPMFQSFKEKGYYETANGNKIAEKDFKAFYLAGNVAPLSWNYYNLEFYDLKFEPTERQHIYQLSLTLNPYKNESSYHRTSWSLKEDISKYPAYNSDQPIVDALYKMTLEEASLNIEKDSTLRTGAKWAGVWTRDISYSIFLAFAYLEPEVAKTSLRKKVKRDRIVQDTGSGGAWPVSTDRIVWAMAAWEVYLVTGDKEWLNEIYPIIKNTIEDDYLTVFNHKNGLFQGESSFLDWRSQSYPKWMDNKDIYMSQCLGTNALYFKALVIIDQIEKIKSINSNDYAEKALNLKQAIQKELWINDKGYFGQFTYGGDHGITSKRFETLGESLCILFDIANENQRSSITNNAPLTAFGTPCFYPESNEVHPYHNNGIWPFVQSYWNIAVAKAGNEQVLSHGLGSIYRSAALFLTNYENMVASTGDYQGTEVNSHRMLWSIAGQLSMVYRVFFGMQFTAEGLQFNPSIPKAYKGKKSLKNFQYRAGIFDIAVVGTGNKIKSFSLDGTKQNSSIIPTDLKGKHQIVIELDNVPFDSSEVVISDVVFAPDEVIASIKKKKISWQRVENATAYHVYKNGQLIDTTSKLYYQISSEETATYLITAINEIGDEGFSCAPIVVNAAAEIFEFEPIENTLSSINYTGKGYLKLTKNKNTKVSLAINVQEEGEYWIDFRYANGSGRWNSHNKCGIRTLYVDHQNKGVFIFPQRGWHEWSAWGYSNKRLIPLTKGEHQIDIILEEWNNNMNVDINDFLLDHMRLIKVKPISSI